MHVGCSPDLPIEAPTNPSSGSPSISLLDSETDNLLNSATELTPAEIEELQRIARIKFYDINLWIATPHIDPRVLVITEASIVLLPIAGVFLPRIKHAILWLTDVNGEMPAQDAFLSDWQLALDGIRTDLVSLPNYCGGSAGGRISVEFRPEAKWEYYQFGSLLHWKVDAPPKTATDVCEGSSPPPGGGGWGGGGEGCEVCQQWFWYEDGVPVSEWWECWYVMPGEPGYELCEEEMTE